MKKIISLVLAISLIASFAVLPAGAATQQNVEQTIRTLGIMRGDGSGNLNLGKAITRAEFAKVMSAASPYKDTISEEGSGYSLFSDVKSSHWASEYIRLAVEQGWMVGYTDRTFRPERTITLEEACSALLKMLGYTSDKLAGSFPASHLSKASALGLRDDVSAKRGDTLNRRDAMYLLYNMLTAKTYDGRDWATTLGYTVSNGEVDYMSVIEETMKGPYVSNGSLSLSFTPTLVYRDGAVSTIGTIAQNDVYYYNADIQTVWIYTDRVSGTVTSLAPTSASPTAVTVSGKQYTIESADARFKLSSMGGGTVGSKVTLLLGMNGTVVDVLKSGEVDNTVVAEDGLRGPFTFDGISLKLPFDESGASYYRNGTASNRSAITQYDIYYYSNELKTVWAFNDRISGKVTALAPSVVSPSSVTLAGKTYSVSTTDASYKLSALNGVAVGDVVTLLLGMDGTVVDVLTGYEVDDVYYGVVMASEKNVDDDGAAGVSTSVTVFCTNGSTQVFTVSREASYAKGSIVSISVSGGETSIKSVSSRTLDGKVNSSATKLGNKAFAEDIEIIDTSSGGNAVVIEPERLASLTLSGDDVRYYALDTSGKISHLILKDVTGDAYTYAYLFSKNDSRGNSLTVSSNFTVSYEYLTDGATRTFSTNNKVYTVETGGVAITYNVDGTINEIKNIGYVTLTGIGVKTASAGNKTYKLADNVQVYLRDGDKQYYKTDVSSINAEDYTLTAFYDNFGAVAGGQIRIIIAEEK